MKAIIPAAGYATRLYPLTKDTPKPLLEVGGKAILGHIVDKIEEIEAVSKIYIITNSRFYEKFRDWCSSYKCNLALEVVNDGTTSNEDRLGAIGDKAFLFREKNIDDDVLDISGDNLFNFSLKGMHNFFLEKKAPVIGAFDIGSLETAKRFGLIELGENKKVTGFQEKPEQPKTTLASIGVYFYPASVVKLVDVYLKEGNNPDAPGYFFEWLHKRESVYGHVFREKWFDIGSLEMLEQARKEIR